MHSKCMVKLVSVKQICRICVYQIFLMHRFNVWFQFHTWSFITSIWMLSMEVTTSVVYPPNWNVFPQWSETSKGNRLKCPNMSSSAQTNTNYNSQKKCRIVLFVLLSWYSYHQLTGHPLPSWPSKGVQRWGRSSIFDLDLQDLCHWSRSFALSRSLLVIFDLWSWSGTVWSQHQDHQFTILQHSIRWIKWAFWIICIKNSPYILKN